MSLKGSITTTSYIHWDTFVSLITRLESKGEYKFCLLISIGVFTGLRISDLLKLKYSDLLDKNTLVLIEQKTGKTRTIRINNDLQTLVQRIYKKQNLTHSNQLIFINRFGSKPIDKSYVNVKLKEIFSKNRIKLDGNISSHILRKTLGRRVMELNNFSNESLVLLMELFGHSSMSITKRYLGIRQQEINDIYLYLSHILINKLKILSFYIN
jgi:integrase